MAFAPAKEVGHGPVDPFVQPGVRSFDLVFPGFHLFLVWDVLRLHTQKQKRNGSNRGETEQEIEKLLGSLNYCVSQG